MINYQIYPKIEWTFLCNNPNKLDRFTVSFKLEDGKTIPNECFTMIAQSANDLIEYKIEITTTHNRIETQEFSTSHTFFCRGGFNIKEGQEFNKFEFYTIGDLEEVVNFCEKIASIISRADLFNLISENLKYSIWSDRKAESIHFTLNNI